MSEPVKVSREPMPVATDAAKRLLIAERFLQHGVPAYIIRHAGERPKTEQEAADIHERHLETVLKDFDRIDPSLKFEPELVEGFVGLGQGPIGLLHTDAGLNAGSKIGDHFEPFLHTTDSGGGPVLAARIGTKPDLALLEWYGPLEGSDRAKKLNNVTHPHNVLLYQDAVDPDLIDPHLYVGEVRAGDSIVMASGDHPKAAWHRMDTDQSLGYRQVRNTELREPGT